MSTNAKPAPAGTQPNILLIHSDQHRFDCLGVNGHTLVQTPNLDRLAAEGANFTHAFCPTPLCTPSRTSLLTGMWPSQHGCIANKGTEAYHPIDESVPTFSQVLKAQGYYLGYAGSGRWAPTAARRTTASTITCPTRPTWRGARSRACRLCRPAMAGSARSTRASAPTRSALAWGASQTIRLLMTASRSERPFFIRWDPREPHLPNIVPEPYASMYAPDRIPPWPSYPDPLTGKPYIQKQQRRTWGVEQWTWRDWSPIVARYLGDISLLDHQVGRLLAALDELGLSRNTLVIYATDHGDLCGGHGMLDKHFVMYDDLVRVPLILRWPGQVGAGRRCDAFISSALDVAATICHAAGRRSRPASRAAACLPRWRSRPQPGARISSLPTTATSSGCTASAWCASGAGNISGTRRPRMNCTTSQRTRARS